jgi:Ser/Thr protein kinase RdoA (MazF antagonist)
VAHAIERISRITLPHIAQDWRESRWDRYADGTAELFAGDTLLHADINPDNLLVGPCGDVTIVDWSWPTHGAAFIDPACLVVQLIAAGHTPAQAENWAARCTAWRETDPAAVDAFAAATVRMYQRFEQLDPQPWRRAMTTAVTDWAAHRGVTLDRDARSQTLRAD